MYLNKLLVRCFWFYAALVTLLTLKRTDGAWTVFNKLALQLGLQRYGMNGYEVNFPTYIAFVVLGIGAAVGLSYFYPTARSKPENDGNKSRVKYHVTYQKWREWQPRR